jgi:hypothetical protein
VDTDWLIFILFVTGCVYSWGALSKSPRKKTYGAISVIILLLLFILAKFGLI